MKNKITMLCAVILLVACGSKKQVAEGPVGGNVPVGETSAASYIQQVNDNVVPTENIVASMSFSVKTGSKNVSAPGSLRMRRDEVIRLQITVPILGSEVARIEFTPDYVLVVDRLHKEYIKASYKDLDFLRDNGIDFYALQALFWNQLHLPGKKTLTQKDLKAFDVDMSRAAIMLKDGKMTYEWATDTSASQISEADVSYKGSASGNSELQWKYSNFKSLEGKLYPTQHNIYFSTNATSKPRQMDVSLQLSGLSSNAKWDALTTVSSKYKEMDAEALLKKILSL